MGRLFASIISDTVGWHDTVGGCTDAKAAAAKYGSKDYQTARNEFYRNGRDCFLIELAKWGLGKRDLVPNLNLFSKIVADEAGALSFVPNNSKAGDHIDLRLEMNTLVVLNTCQHPFDPDPAYRPRKVKLEVFPSAPVLEGDASLAIRPENARAYQNTQDYYTLRTPSL
jgi:urea carboxylase-associated protein 2